MALLNENFCGELINQLTNWRAVDAAIQNGGFERGSQGQVEQALSAALGPSYIVVPEYKRRSPAIGERAVSKMKGVSGVTNEEKKEAVRSLGTMDFAIAPVEEGADLPSRLPVCGLVEVKFNYAGQSELKGRLRRAGQQVLRYKQSCSSVPSDVEGYVLYLVAALNDDTPSPTVDRDSGWQYLVNSRGRLREAIGYLEAQTGVGSPLNICRVSEKEPQSTPAFSLYGGLFMIA